MITGACGCWTTWKLYFHWTEFLLEEWLGVAVVAHKCLMRPLCHLYTMLLKHGPNNAQFFIKCHLLSFTYNPACRRLEASLVRYSSAVAKYDTSEGLARHVPSNAEMFLTKLFSLSQLSPRSRIENHWAPPRSSMSSVICAIALGFCRSCCQG